MLVTNAVFVELLINVEPLTESVVVVTRVPFRIVVVVAVVVLVVLALAVQIQN